MTAVIRILTIISASMDNINANLEVLQDILLQQHTNQNKPATDNQAVSSSNTAESDTRQQPRYGRNAFACAGLTPIYPTQLPEGFFERHPHLELPPPYWRITDDNNGPRSETPPPPYEDL